MPYNGMKDSLFSRYPWIFSNGFRSYPLHSYQWSPIRILFCVHDYAGFTEVVFMRKTPFQNITPGNPLHWPVSRLCLKSPMYQLL